LPDERYSEPIVIIASGLENLWGKSPDDIFVYRFDQNSGWQQIPHQVDERQLVQIYGGGSCDVSPEECDLQYIFDWPEGDGLDDNDEIVFMARDLGNTPTSMMPEDVSNAYQVQVTIPGSNQVGYAYIFYSTTLTKSFGPPLVSYSRTEIDIDEGIEDTEIITDNYRVHFSGQWIQDALEVSIAAGGDQVNLLDRWKGRAYDLSLYGETEDRIGMCAGWSNPTPDWGEHIYLGHKSGPVRAIRSIQGACSWPNLTRSDLFYDNRVDIVLNVRGHAFGPDEGGLWSYWDFSQAASPLTYYNLLIPGGTTLDGVEDPSYSNGDHLAITSGWDQVDSPHGGAVFYFEQTIPIPGQVKAFILDDLDHDDGTGVDPANNIGVIGGTGIHITYIADTEPIFGGTPAQVIIHYWPQAANVGNIGQSFAETIESKLILNISPVGSR
jgi:hypothetical protein